MEVIRAEHVSYSYVSKYQTVRVLEDISYNFLEGTFYAITGRSGSGKSTFLSLLAGLDLPTEGAVYRQDQSLKEMDRDKYRMYDVSIIFQAFHLFPLLNVLENVMFPMKIQKAPKKQMEQRAKAFLEKVGLTEACYRKYPGMLSGGEQQRVAIARAMAAGGKILLADEPTGNLDSHNEETVIQLLRKLVQEEGYTVIVVTHNENVTRAADMVLEMADGHLIEVNKNDSQ